MDGIIRDFIAESGEAMEKYDGLLLALEKDGAGLPDSDNSGIAKIFRIAHTLKGSCGFLGFPKLEGLTHAGENLLGLLRDGKLSPDARVVGCLLRMGDAIRDILRQIETTGSDAQSDYSELAKVMEALRSVGPGAPAASPVEDWSGGPATQELRAAPETNNPDPGSAADRTLRVDVGVLDQLMNLVGELVLVRNQMLQHAGTLRGGPVPATAQQLNLITGELQEAAMKTRMQPIRNIWSRLPRLVRDLARTCGKTVRLEMEGGSTGLDKTILEAIKDPLTHILRNSIDHGIELPAERLRQGKPAEGLIRLNACHKGGQIHIEIEDDGAGIDVGRVAFKALEKGLVTSEQIGRMTEWELAQLIFLPGFSTADTVTNVSGRGVGMDVVKNHVERIGGSVDLANRPGRGLTLRIRIPLTLAIIPALIVKAAGQRFAIPQINVDEVIRLKSDEPGKGVEWVLDHPVFRLRGGLLPLLRLESVFRTQGTPSPTARGQIPEDFVAVVHTDSTQFGILLSSVRDTQEIVVKPTSKHLKSVVFFAGAAIMGDGKVALILDVSGLAQAARLPGADSGNSGARSDSRPAVAVEGGIPRENLLLAEVTGTGLVAFPLAGISRLEKVPADSLERIGDRQVLQSRGHLIPVFRLREMYPGRELAPVAPVGSIYLVVITKDGNSAAIEVDRILDAVEESLELEPLEPRPGVRGTAIIRGRAVEVLDPDYLLAAAHDTAPRAEVR